MKKIWILFAAAALAVGCSDNKSEEGGETPNQLSLSAETLTFLVDGTSDGNNAVTVTSDGDWRLIGYQAWCTPSATSGKTGDKITFSVAENPLNDARSASYTFIRGNKAAKLVVSQLQNSVYETITSEAFTLNSLRQTITFIVRTSFGFEPEITAPWIVNTDLEQTRGVETRFLRFLVEENPEHSDREGKIYVTEPNGTRHELTINQNQKHAIVIPKKLYNVNAEGGTVTVSVQSNVNYRATMAGYPWITEDTDATRALNPSQKTFRIENSSETRQGRILLLYSPVDGSPAVIDTVMIAQRAGQPIQVTVPDANFRKFLSKNDYVLLNSDNPVCEMTGKGVALQAMACSNLKIASLKGIEAFKALKTLNLSYNNLTEIDLSANTALTSLVCAINELKALDLSANTALTSLNCGKNRLTKLDLTKCTLLRMLTMDNNPIEEVILHPEAMITSLGATTLYTLDKSVYASKLKVVGAKLISVACNGNQLTELDVTGCPAVKTLNCYDNQLTKLDMTGCGEITSLICYNNQLAELDMTAFPKLTMLTCYNNKLSELNVTGCSAITNLSCYGNQLSALDVTDCTKLFGLSCYDNKLTGLDVSQCANLGTLECNTNALEALDVAACQKLWSFNCSSNKLTTLDVSVNLKLTTLNCSTNPAMTTLYMAQGQAIRTLTKDEQTEIVRK